MSLTPEFFALLRAIIVIVIGLIITKIVVDILRKLIKTEGVKNFIKGLGYEETILDLPILILKYLFYFITLMIAIAQFGFGVIVIEVILAIIVLAFGFLIIFSLKDLIPNLAAGIWIAREKPFKVGDKVRIGLYEGEVKSFTLTVTQIEDENGRIIMIPNSIIVRREVINEGIHIHPSSSRKKRRYNKRHKRK